ncbi:MAG: recombination protein RecR [Candidatus Colwellbacteria bacterium]|nr:recombination protein RecR [Candidatus Colwellbacteria bacterium]
MKVPSPLTRFVEIFSALPGIGPRQAVRLAFFFVEQGVAFEDEVAKTILGLKGIKICRQCFYIHQNENGLCGICADKNRNPRLIAIVEKETDLMSIENTGQFHGRYLILGDMRKTGILEAAQKLRLNSLKAWIEKELEGKAEEIIIALNPSPQGELLAGLITEEFKDLADKISRLGRGIPSGGEIEFADEETLGSALKRRE